MDYQVWCGSAMGAFNEWVKGTFLERPENRRVVAVGLNILYGAAVMLRVNAIKSQGVRVLPELSRPVPCELAKLNEVIYQ